jgi:hypothetical protein
LLRIDEAGKKCDTITEYQEKYEDWAWWFMPVIPDTQEP